MATQQDHYFRGMELFGEDDLDGAISEFQKALAIDDSYGDALHAIALCHYHLGQLGEAVEYGERLRGVEPDNPARLYRPVDVLQRQRDDCQSRGDGGEGRGCPSSRRHCLSGPFPVQNSKFQIPTWRAHQDSRLCPLGDGTDRSPGSARQPQGKLTVEETTEAGTPVTAQQRGSCRDSVTTD